MAGLEAQGLRRRAGGTRDAFRKTAALLTSLERKDFAETIFTVAQGWKQPRANGLKHSGDSGR